MFSIHALIFLINEDKPLIGDGAEYGPRFVGRAVIHNYHLHVERFLTQELMHQVAYSGLRIEGRDNDADINFRLHTGLRYAFPSLSSF